MAELIAPSGKIDLAAVSGLHEQLVAQQGNDIVLDLQDVSQIGALCLQTMLAAAQSAAANDTRFHATNASDRVQAQLAAMGIPFDTFMEGAP